jgi:hypothetical protein
MWSFQEALREFNKTNPPQGFYSKNVTKTPKREKTLTEVVEAKHRRMTTHAQAEKYRKQDQEALDKERRVHANKGISNKEKEKLLKGKSAKVGGKRNSRKTRRYKK